MSRREAFGARGAPGRAIVIAANAFHPSIPFAWSEAGLCRTACCRKTCIPTYAAEGGVRCACGCAAAAVSCVELTSFAGIVVGHEPHDSGPSPGAAAASHATTRTFREPPFAGSRFLAAHRRRDTPACSRC
jgi:hypothetical protein